MSEPRIDPLYQVYVDLGTWTQVWKLADDEMRHGLPVNRDHWNAVRWQADEHIKELEFDLSKRLPSGVYHHRRTERRE